ncbi:MAG: class I SAM-dependent methyltransferase, partial [Chloroflexi bacterium]|nr:class I SAM-dependent methyltransferase [Chloroflexota bacterium]
FLFWERLYRVIQHVERKGKLSAVMDFGCGSGVMLPVLSRLSDQVTAVDIDLAPSQRIGEFVSFAGNVTFASSCESVPPGSLDLILALDVLEHVDDLNAILADLCALLSPGGEIIVSGPTENMAYKVGRFLAGPVYSGDYHVRDIYQIKQALQKFVDVRTLATLFFPVPLFVIYSGTA